MHLYMHIQTYTCTHVEMNIYTHTYIPVAIMQSQRHTHKHTFSRHFPNMLSVMVMMGLRSNKILSRIPRVGTPPKKKKKKKKSLSLPPFLGPYHHIRLHPLPLHGQHPPRSRDPRLNLVGDHEHVEFGAEIADGFDVSQGGDDDARLALDGLEDESGNLGAVGWTEGEGTGRDGWVRVGAEIFVGFFHYFCVWICMYAYMHISIHTYKQTYIHTNIHTHRHAQIHTHIFNVM